MMKDKTTLGKFIKEKRKELGLSQKELADRLFVTESAVSKWERGVSYPDITMISGICENLCISEHELFIAGEDSAHRRVEQLARKYTIFKWTYNIILALGYLGAIIPCFIIFVVREHNLSKFFILLTSLMMTASLLNVPILIEKHKASAALAGFYISLNLLLLSGCVYSRGDWFIMAFLSLFMSFTVVFLPFIVRSEAISPYIGKNKSLVCMAADTLLIFALVAYGTHKYGNLYDLRSGLCGAAIVLVLVWVIFITIRYIKVNVAFKISICLGVSGIFTYFANTVLSLAIDGCYLKPEPISSPNTITAVSAVGAALAAAIAGIVIRQHNHTQ
ncbi:MAG: helix-turn-helix domain-containing protein [Ruminococcus sp.]|nr:helix-turn-helix domain-containing protein [Ruminococcus sp.]